MVFTSCRALRAWAVAVTLIVSPVSVFGQNLLDNGGFEDYSNGGGNDARLEAAGSLLITGAMTIDPTDAEFQKILDNWGRGANGNWTGGPAGSDEQGIDSIQTRKTGLKWFQAFEPTIVEDLNLDWQYYVGTDINATNSGAGTAITNQVVVFGVNQAGDGEAATTINPSSGALAGEAGNFAVLADVSLTVPAGTADGLWHDAPTTLVSITDDWDYIGIYFARTAGVTNSTSQMMDNFSLTAVPEPGAMAGAAVGMLLGRRRRRAAR